MHPVDGPIMQSRDAERTTVADPLGEHLPTVTKVAPVPPYNARHVHEVARFGGPQAKRQPALQTPAEVVLYLVGH